MRSTVPFLPFAHATLGAVSKLDKGPHDPNGLSKSGLEALFHVWEMQPSLLGAWCVLFESPCNFV